LTTLATRNLVDSRRLLYFYHVARLGSFSLAETYLDIAQSAITRQIQQFEAEMGAELLRRNGRGVELTTAGKVAYAHAEKLMAEMALMQLDVEAAVRKPVSFVSIAASTSFMTLYMPEAVRQFTQSHPQVRLQAFEGSSGRVYDMLIAGEVDMAVVLHATNSKKLKLRKLTVDPLVLLVHKDHPLSSRKRITPDDLAGLKLVLPASPFGSRLIIEQYFAQAGVRVEPVLELDSLALTLSAIRNPELCTILPDLVLRAFADPEELVMIPLMPALARTVYLAHLRDRAISAPARALMAALAAAVSAAVLPDRARRRGGVRRLD
jgi:LysR family nitrogen assimilation transcriptional regulator